jgi:hypothetical protein
VARIRPFVGRSTPSFPHAIKQENLREKLVLTQKHGVGVSQTARYDVIIMSADHKSRC